MGWLFLRRNTLRGSTRGCRSEDGKRRKVCDPSGRRQDAGSHERVTRRSECSLRSAVGDGEDQLRCSPETDVAIVVGANDVTNPAARTKQDSPLYGMPILDVDKAKTVVFIKRSMNPGFSGMDNELFYLPNTMMVFGDAKKVLTDIVAALEKKNA